MYLYNFTAHASTSLTAQSQMTVSDIIYYKGDTVDGAADNFITKGVTSVQDCYSLCLQRGDSSCTIFRLVLIVSVITVTISLQTIKYLRFVITNILVSNKAAKQLIYSFLCCVFFCFVFMTKAHHNSILFIFYLLSLIALQLVNIMSLISLFFFAKTKSSDVSEKTGMEMSTN